METNNDLHDTSSDACLLLGLPLELREYIYYLALGCDDHSSTIQPVVDNKSAALPKKDFPLLRANKQIFAEANAVLLRESRILVDPWDWDVLSRPARQASVLRTGRYLDIAPCGSWETAEIIKILTKRGDLRVLRIHLTKEGCPGVGHFNVESVQAFEVLKKWAKVKVCMSAEFCDEPTNALPFVPRDAQMLRQTVDNVATEMKKGCRCKKSKNGEHVEEWA